MLEIGQQLPDFKLQDNHGEIVTREDLLDAPFVLYFYPKDNTPGCTTEACDFRDLMESFEEMNILVIGVSSDSVESHQKFIQNHGLNFTLLSDPDRSLAKSLGVAKPGDSGIIRSTFLFNDEGIVEWVESPVTVAGHVQRVINAIQES